MGEPKEVWSARIALLKPYAVTADVMRATGNPLATFMHCLPAYHDLGTVIGREINAQHGLDYLEVSDEVFESPQSVVFDQAENRMHTIKAILVATLS
jgi:ornithine carbamoyltransferase